MNYGNIAVVGNGISAGLLTYLLSHKNKITLFQDKDYIYSSIPEIIPRKYFFETLGLNNNDQLKIIDSTKSHITDFMISQNNSCNLHSMITNDSFYVFDKEKLSSFLISSSTLKDIKYEKITDINLLKKFDLIFDCRGKKAILNDSNYNTRIILPAKTKCSYIILKSDKNFLNTRMSFWKNHLKNKQTFFVIPTGINKFSIGCSYNPNQYLNNDNLIEIASQYGFEISNNQIISSGEALPSILKSSTTIKNVIPVGEAYESSCPLTEYGVLKSLNQIFKIVGNPFIQLPIKRPVNNTEIDPHIPMELFS
ncbi:MAG: hypothetical protein WCC23_01940 [Acinetobacter calcoaceticus]